MKKNSIKSARTAFRIDEPVIISRSFRTCPLAFSGCDTRAPLIPWQRRSSDLVVANRASEIEGRVEKRLRVDEVHRFLATRKLITLEIRYSIRRFSEDFRSRR
jgi:hypothetical protein